jgi:hypothetical protein
MAVITLGNDAIDRAAQTTANVTAIIRDNYATATGVIDTVNLYVAVETVGTKVGTFYLVSGTTYMCRATVTLGDLSTGVHNISGLNLRCVIGDFIGYWHITGSLDRENTGGVVSTYVGDGCVAGVSQSFSDGTRLISIGGSGLGWSTISKYNGVEAANIYTINGIAMQNISKINGVAV